MLLKLLFLCLLLVAPARGEEPSAAALLDQVIKEPGAWNQMCDIPRPKDLSRFPSRGIIRDWVWYWVGPDQFRTLRAQREGVVTEIGRRLDADRALHVAWAGQELSPSPREIPSLPLEIYLVTLVDLNGVEALPALLRLEKGLDGMALYKASITGKLNASRSKEVEYFEPREGISKKYRVPDRMYAAYLIHEQVLSTITALLANETKAQFPEKLAYDQATRDDIIARAETLAKQSHFLGAAAMDPNPRHR
jgi:hypothetical protein